MTGYITVLMVIIALLEFLNIKIFTKEQHEKSKRDHEVFFLEIEHLADKYVEEMSTGELRKCIG